MTDRHDRLIDLASALADGAPIDWDAAVSSAASDSERRQISRMRIVRQLADAQSGSTASASQTGGVHESILTPGGASTNGDAAPVTWGPLRVLEKIGRGRFGDVYRAWDPRLDREVALKLLRHRAATTDDLGTSVIEEGRLLAKIRHPNVVTVYGAGRIDDRVGVWMELVRGRTLEAELAARGPLPADDVAAIGIDLCRALGAVHRAGLVHRDVKAQNVMRDEDGRLVLMDFGTGRELDTESASELAGTPLYLAPEILNGQPATAKSDLYSLGVLLYHLATGVFPVSGRTLREIRDGHTRGASATSAALAGVPPALAGALGRALSRDPAGRITDAAAFEAALLSGSRSGASPASSSRRRWLAASLAVVAIGGAVAAIAMANRSPAGSPVPTERVVWTGPTVPDQATVSDDGRSLAYVDDGGRIMLRRLAGGDDRPLTVAELWPGSLAFSRDATRLAYTAGHDCCSAHRIQLRVVDLIGSGLPESRLVRDHGDDEWLDVFDWSADGSRIAVRLERYQKDGRVGFVSVADGQLHVVATLNWRGSQRVSISPDGAWLAYDATADERTMQRDVFIAPTGGGQSRAILTGSHRESVIGWSPDGRHLVVTSDRDGQPALMALPILNGAPAGEAARVQASADADVIGLSTSGAVFVNTQVSRPSMHLSSVDFATGQLIAGPTVVPVFDNRAHTQAPMFSPDGESLAFVSRRPRRDTERTILIHSAGTSALTDLPVKLSQIWTFSWAPDRRSLLARATDFDGRQGIHQIDTHTGVSRPILLNGEVQYFQPQWADDGSSFYYTRVAFRGAIGTRGAYLKRHLDTGQEEMVLEARSIRSDDGEPFPGMRDWTISPDGHLIAGVTMPAGSAPDAQTRRGIVWVISVADGRARKLFEDPAGRFFTANSLHWTADGQAVVVNRRVGESARELWLVPLQGQPRKLDVGAPDLTNERFALHPDGRQIAFMSGRFAAEIRAVEHALPDPARASSKANVKAVGAPLAFQRRDWLLVTDFQNSSREPELDASVQFAFEQQLRLSTFVNVIGRERIEDALMLLDRPLDSHVTPPLARDVSRLDGVVRAWIGGSIGRSAVGYRLTIEVVNPLDGTTVTSFEADAPDAVGLIRAVPRVSDRVRAFLGEPAADVAGSHRAGERAYAPASLREFAIGARLAMRWNFAEAEPLLASAVRADPDFALARTYLAWAQRNLHRPRQDYLKHAAQALTLAPAALETEKLFIEGSFHELRDDCARALAPYEALVRQHQTDLFAANNLSNCYRLLHRETERLPILLRVAELRPNSLDKQATAARFLFDAGDEATAFRFARRAIALLAQLPKASLATIAARTPNAIRVTNVYGRNLAWLEGNLPELQRWIAAEVPLDRPEVRNQTSFHADDWLGLNVGWYLTLGRFNDAHSTCLKQSEVSRTRCFARVAEARGDPGQPRVDLGHESASVAKTGRPIFEARRDLARARLAKGEVVEAIRLLETADRERSLALGWSVADTPTGGDVWLEIRSDLARMYRQTGRAREAIVLEDTVLKLLALADPGHPVVAAITRERAK